MNHLSNTIYQIIDGLLQAKYVCSSSNYSSSVKRNVLEKHKQAHMYVKRLLVLYQKLLHK
jgi:flagellar biosynthesis component FlhA